MCKVVFSQVYSVGKVCSNYSWQFYGLNKFVSSVSEGVIKECKTSMFVKKMDISQLMFYTQQSEWEKINKMERENKRAIIGSFNFS